MSKFRARRFSESLARDELHSGFSLSARWHKKSRYIVIDRRETNASRSLVQRGSRGVSWFIETRNSSNFQVTLSGMTDVEYRVSAKENHDCTGWPRICHCCIYKFLDQYRVNIFLTNINTIAINKKSCFSRKCKDIKNIIPRLIFDCFNKIFEINYMLEDIDFDKIFKGNN